MGPKNLNLKLNLKIAKVNSSAVVEAIRLNDNNQRFVTDGSINLRSACHFAERYHPFSAFDMDSPTSGDLIGSRRSRGTAV